MNSFLRFSFIFERFIFTIVRVKILEGTHNTSFQTVSHGYVSFFKDKFPVRIRRVDEEGHRVKKK